MLWKFGKWILLIDTIDFEILLHKMQKLNYSADLPQCTPSYLYNRKHFKQIIYINPLECLRDQSIDLYYLIISGTINNCEYLQSADDTTLYQHCKVDEDIKQKREAVNGGVS